MKSNSIEFYNQVADQYDEQMSYNSKLNRENIERIMLDMFEKGNSILDFGGGTGSDSIWMVKNGYSVTYLDNSNGMIDIAKKKFKNNDCSSLINIVENENIDFRNWTAIEIPYHGILANNCVINSIFDISSLFRKLHLVLKSNGKLVLVYYRKKNRKSSLVSRFKSLIFPESNRSKIHVVHNQGVTHQTLLYTANDLKNAYNYYFTKKYEMALLDDLHLICLEKI